MWLASSFFSWRGDKTTHEEEVNIMYKFATVPDINTLYMCLIHLMLHLLQKHLDKSFCFITNIYVELYMKCWTMWKHCCIAIIQLCQRSRVCKPVVWAFLFLGGCCIVHDRLWNLSYIIVSQFKKTKSMKDFLSKMFSGMVAVFMYLRCHLLLTTSVNTFDEFCTAHKKQMC